MRNDIWTREQLIIALNLYWKVPYNKISGSSNNQIKEISSIIGRTPAALAYKLMNFTSLDTEKQGKGNKGKSGIGKRDKIIWDEYLGNWEKLAFDNLMLLAQIQNKSLDAVINIEPEWKDFVGREKERVVKVRVNQNDFRQRILASYNNNGS